MSLDPSENVSPHSRGAKRSSDARSVRLSIQKAQGKPAARCTRSLACEIK